MGFLTKKWAKENGYRLRKDLFAFTDDKIAVQVELLLDCITFPLDGSTNGGYVIVFLRMV